MYFLRLSESVTMKRGDTRRTFNAQLLDNTNTPIDLTNASVDLNIASKTGFRLNKPAVVENGSNGQVSFSFEENDLTGSGDLEAEFAITFPDQDVLTVPSVGYFPIKIYEILTDRGQDSVPPSLYDQIIASMHTHDNKGALDRLSVSENNNIMIDNVEQLGGPSALSDLQDVSTNTPTEGQVLKFIGGSWKPGVDEIGGSASSATVYDVTGAPYNADNSGGTSAYSAIQSAIDDLDLAGGGILYLPKGTYLIDQKVVLSNNVIVKGDGKGVTIIKQIAKPDGTNSYKDTMIVADTKSNVVIKNLTIDGDKNNRPDAINDPYSHVIEISKCNYFLIENVEVVRGPGASINIWNSSDGLVRDNLIHECGSNGILTMQTCANIRILDNYVDGTDNQNCIFVSNQIGKSASNIWIVGNTAKNSADYAIEVGHTENTPADPVHNRIYVLNNYVDTCVGAGIGLRSVSNCVVGDNMIVDYGTNGGYGCEGIFAEGREQQCENLIIRDNVLVQSHGQPTMSYGIMVTGYRKSTIKDNNVINPTDVGVAIIATNIGGTTTDYPDGYRVFQDIKLINNTVIGSGSDAYHIQGYDAKDMLIDGNTAEGSVNRGFNIANLNMCHGIIFTKNLLTGNGLEGVLFWNQDRGIVSDNQFINNGINAGGGNTDENCAIVQSGEGTFVISNNIFEDDQQTATQLYYLKSNNNTTGEVRVKGSVIMGYQSTDIISGSNDVMEEKYDSSAKKAIYRYNGIDYDALGNAL